MWVCLAADGVRGGSFSFPPSSFFLFGNGSNEQESFNYAILVQFLIRPFLAEMSELLAGQVVALSRFVCWTSGCFERVAFLSGLF